MKEVIGTETSTIVVVGTWNKAIFTPEWVKQNVLQDSENFKIDFPIPAVSNSLKFSTEEFSFCIVNDRLIFELLRNTESAYLNIVKSLRVILRLLSQTPIYAFGLNFVFDSEISNSKLSRIDNTDIINIIGHDLKEKKLTLSFSLTDYETLNIGIDSHKSITRYDYNFDYKVKNAIDIVNVISSDRIILEKRDLALRVQSVEFRETL